MEDKQLTSLLKGAGDIPDCPTDKFVAAFLNEMDKDFVINAKPKSKAPFYAALAACLAIVCGGLVVNQMGLFGNNEQIYSDADFVQTTSVTAPEDEFASQLVGYEDISTIVPLEDM